jgi:DNA-binding CsgD family transcriptional regulator
VKLTDEQLDTLGKKYRLSPRERQILALLFEGLPTNQAIADRLGTTEPAIRAGCRTLYLKTQARSKHEMTVRLMLELLRDLPAQQLDQFRRDAEATD